MNIKINKEALAKISINHLTTVDGLMRAAGYDIDSQFEGWWRGFPQWKLSQETICHCIYRLFTQNVKWI